MAPGHLAAVTKAPQNSPVRSLVGGAWFPHTQTFVQALFPVWSTPFTSIKSLSVAFDISEQGEWIPPAWFEIFVSMVGERVRKKAARNVVLTSLCRAEPDKFLPEGLMLKNSGEDV